MERDYIKRRTPSPRQSSRRKIGPPPFLVAMLAVILIAILVIIIVVAVKSSKRDNDDDLVSSALSSNVSEAETSSTPEVAPTPAPTAAPTNNDPDSAPTFYDSIMTVDGVGYEYYSFNETNGKAYIDAVTDGAKGLSSATMYTMIIPSSMDVLLSDSYLETHEVASSNQKSAINWFHSSFNAIDSSIKTVSVFDTLKSHNSEYLYFRSDSHWTQLGAYYAYKEFCAAKGLTAASLDDFEKQEYTGYLGSYYNSVYDETMGSNADTVEAYISSDDTSLSYTDSDGNTQSGWPVILDGSDYDSSYLYYIFCAGNQPYEVLTNNSLSDGSTCVVVKDSSGNVLLPFLTKHYQTIYAIDYRYYSGSAVQLANEVGAADLLVATEIKATASSDSVSGLKTVLS